MAEKETILTKEMDIPEMLAGTDDVIVTGWTGRRFPKSTEHDGLSFFVGPDFQIPLGMNPKHTNRRDFWGRSDSGHQWLADMVRPEKVRGLILGRFSMKPGEARLIWRRVKAGTIQDRKNGWSTTFTYKDF